MRGVTFGAPDGDLGLSWLGRLSGALTAAIPRPDRPSAIVMANAATHLVLEDVALAYMPPHSKAAGAAAATRGTALVALARGVHTSAVGSARYVEACDVKVALGGVRAAGAAPWGMVAPPRGWDAAACRGFGLDVVFTESALCAVVDASAPVDSDVRRSRERKAGVAWGGGEQQQAERAESYSTEAVQLTAQGLTGCAPLAATVRSVDAADPLLNYVQRRQTPQSGAADTAAVGDALDLSQSMTAFGWATAMQASEAFGQPSTVLERSLYRSAAPHGISASTPSSPLCASTTRALADVRDSTRSQFSDSRQRAPDSRTSSCGSSSSSSSSSRSSHLSLLRSRAAVPLAATMYHDITAAQSSTFDEIFSLTSSGGLGADMGRASWIGPADPLQAAAARGAAAGRLRRTTRVSSSSTLGSSDPELLTGEEAATMHLVLVSLSDTAVTLWPDAIDLARRFCQQAVASSGPPARSGQSTSGAAAAEHAGGARRSEERASDEPVDDGSRSVSEQDDSCVGDGDAAVRLGPPDAGARSSTAHVHQFAGGQVSETNGAHPDRLLHISASPAAFISQRDASPPASAAPLRPVPVGPALARQASAPAAPSDGKETLIAARLTGAPRGSLSPSRWVPDAASMRSASSLLASSQATRWHDARSRHASMNASRSVAASAAVRGYASVMHDMQVDEQSVVAIGYPLAGEEPGAPVRGFSAAGVPTDQEQDGHVDVQFSSQEGGLQNAVRADYVSASTDGAPQAKDTGHTPRPEVEAVAGHLREQYPDSTSRFTATSGKLSVTLRSAPPERSKAPPGRVRATVVGMQLQHDSFPSAAACHMRAAASVHRLAVHQQGFGKAQGRRQRDAQAAASAAADAGDPAEWRAVATRLHHGPYNPRKDMARALVRVQDDEGGPRHATVSLRLPSLRLKLTQPTVEFLQVQAAGAAAFRATCCAACCDAIRH